MPINFTESSIKMLNILGKSLIKFPILSVEVNLKLNFFLLLNFKLYRSLNMAIKTNYADL